MSMRRSHQVTEYPAPTGRVAGRGGGRTRRGDLQSHRPAVRGPRADRFRGREGEVTQLVRTSTQDFIARGEGMGLTVSQWVTAALYNGLARYEDAFAAAAQAAADPHELWFSTFAAVELIEAASRSGRSQRAAEALELLSESTRASGTPWALGVEARSRALLDRGEAAETLYREAIARLQPHACLWTWPGLICSRANG